MVSTLDQVLARARQDAIAKQPAIDTGAIFAEAQKNAIVHRLFTPPPLTPEAASTPAVVVVPQEIKPRTDIKRFIQPVTIKGH